MGRNGPVIAAINQPAAIVILASHAVQNPRILLNSVIDKHPGGLANSSGLVKAIFDEDLENDMATSGNLILAGTGLNPTEGGVHPTFTVHALAMPTAEHMLSHCGSMTA
jgi:choline dehydrogenase-like flavoprotein